MPSFFDHAERRSLVQDNATSDSNASITEADGLSRVETEIAEVAATSGPPQPLVLFCKSMDVDPREFLTTEVTGKASIMTALITASERFAVYRAEKHLYESSWAFCWQTSNLAQLMSKVEDHMTKVKSLMLQVSAIRIDPKLLLTTTCAQSVVKKMALLEDLAPAVAILGNDLNAAIRQLRIRNSQIRARGFGRSQTEIRLNCLNCPEMMWVQATDAIVDAVVGDGDVGTPLDAKQQLKIAQAGPSDNKCNGSA